MALDLVNLFQAIEVVPGGRFNADPATERLLSVLQPILNNIITEINEGGDTNTITITVGAGTMGPWQIAHTQSPVLTNTDYAPLTNAQKCLRLLTDGTMIFAWREKENGTNRLRYYARKSVAPYNRWTNLAGNSQESEEVASFLPSSASAEYSAITFAQNQASGNLLFFYSYQSGGNKIIEAKEWVRGGDGTFSVGSTHTVDTDALWTNSGMVACADAVGTEDRVILLCNRDENLTGVGGGCVGKVYTADNGNMTAWVERATFRNFFAGVVTATGDLGRQQRLVDLGGGRVLAVMEDELSASRRNLLWALSQDNGVTWPGTVFGQVAGTGGVLPLSGAGYATGNVETARWGSDNYGGVWDVGAIAGTTRAGLIYRGVREASSGNRDPGVMYAEFDAALNSGTGGWWDQADHLFLSRHAGVTQTGGGYVGEGNRFWQVFFCGADGVPRAFWMHNYLTSADGFHTAMGIAYRRLVTGGNPKAATDWLNAREIQTFFSDQYASKRVIEMTGLREGTVSVDEGDVRIPIAYTRLRDNVSTSYHFPGADFLLQLWPVAEIDRV